MVSKFSICEFLNPSKPFKDGGDNDYSCFDSLKGRYGIYVFQDKIEGNILYIGMCGKNKCQSQDIKDRIIQNYTKGDTGGTFRDNWMGSERTFDQFKNSMSSWKIITASIASIKLQENIDLIESMESYLIFHTRPRYNTKFQTIPHSEKDTVRNIMKIIRLH